MVEQLGVSHLVMMCLKSWEINHFGYGISILVILCADRWAIECSKKRYSERFLNDQSSGYYYCAPSTDPRYSAFIPPDAKIQDTDPRYSDQYHWRYNYRQNEVSQDEIVGLVAGYSIVYNLVKIHRYNQWSQNKLARLPII